MRIFLFIILIINGNLLFGQTYKTQNFSFPLKGITTLKTDKNDFNPNLIHLEAPNSGGNSYRDYLAKIKAELPAKKHIKNQQVAHKKSETPSVYVRSNFRANPYNGIPNDNHVAISNSGSVVSVINSTVFIYNQSGELQENMGLKKFSESLNLPEHRYDPRVVYDEVADRFVMVILNGNYDSTSAIVWAFSRTNDPTGEWYLYEMSGNPLNDQSWSDYPMLAISNTEVFFTINLLRNGGTWQESFKQTVIWQIDKEKAFKGEGLETRLYSDIGFEGKAIRNLCPVKRGSGIDHDDCYFLSNRNFSIESDSIFLLHINGKKDAASTKLSTELLTADNPYGVPPVVDQTIAYGLQTNDSRVLDAYIENGEIWFVGNSIYPENNYGGIYFGKHKVNSSSVSAQYIGSDTLEYGYPGIVYSGDGTSMDAIILANHSHKEVYPGCGAFYVDDKGISDYKVIKEGESHIFIFNGPQRWGDYSGIQRKYNEPGKVWISATYGLFQQGGRNKYQYATWIAELHKQGLSVPKTTELSQPSVYPNPLTESKAMVQFEAAVTCYAEFTLFDIQGRKIETLLVTQLKKGNNAIFFSVKPLEKGQYFLVVMNRETKELIVKEPIIIP